MYIKEFHIKNFKGFKDVTFEFNPDINILTGLNNSGKTTVLEAIALWQECFYKLLRQAGRAGGGEFQMGDFILGTGWLAIDREDLHSARKTGVEDIFTKSSNDNTVYLEANVAALDETIGISFYIKKQAHDYAIRHVAEDGFDYGLFNRMFVRFPQPVTLTTTMPLAQLKPEEYFETYPNLAHHINTRNTAEVLRNRLRQLASSRPAKYNQLLDNLSFILNDGRNTLKLHIEGDVSIDRKVKVAAELGASGPIELQLWGSGMIQLLQVLLPFYPIDDPDLNLILLDEPDSHIHRDIQQRLLLFLDQKANEKREAAGAGISTQVFLTTHNESLIRSANYHHLFHLDEKAQGVLSNIVQSKNIAGGRGKGVQPIPNTSILSTFGSTTGLDFISALECDRLFIVEGTTDAAYLGTMIQQGARLNNHAKYAFWVLGGVDAIFKRIRTYYDMFRNLKNNQPLWNKTHLVFDKDSYTSRLRNALQETMAKGLKLEGRLHIWESYNFEATMLAEPEKLIGTLARYLNREKGQQASEDEVANYVEGALEKVLEQKKELLEDQNHHRTVVKQYQRRFFHLTDNKLSIPGHEVKDLNDDYEASSKLEEEYRQYLESALNIKQVHLIAQKEDVEQVIQTVFSAYGLNFSLENDLMALIHFMVPITSIIPDDWKAVIRMG